MADQLCGPKSIAHSQKLDAHTSYIDSSYNKSVRAESRYILYCEEYRLDNNRSASYRRGTGGWLVIITEIARSEDLLSFERCASERP